MGHDMKTNTYEISLVHEEFSIMFALISFHFKKNVLISA